MTYSVFSGTLNPTQSMYKKSTTFYKILQLVVQRIHNESESNKWSSAYTGVAKWGPTGLRPSQLEPCSALIKQK